MTSVETAFLALGLCMDSLAVALSLGLPLSQGSQCSRRVLSSGSPASGQAIRNLPLLPAFKVALSFAVFQALMPFLGWLAGVQLKGIIQSMDHWIAFGLLFLIGVKMMFEARTQGAGSAHQERSLAWRPLLALGVATSIDALAVGVGFAFMSVSIIQTCLVIGMVTFLVSFIGVLVGCRAGDACGKGARIVGGTLLIALGFKILMEHLQ